MVTGAFEEMAPPLCDGSQPPSPRTGPRFYVSELEGWAGLSVSGHGKQMLSVSVIDSARGYAEVARWVEEKEGWQGLGQFLRRRRIRERAAVLCEQLEAQHVTDLAYTDSRL